MRGRALVVLRAARRERFVAGTKPSGRRSRERFVAGIVVRRASRERFVAGTARWVPPPGGRKARATTPEKPGPGGYPARPRLGAGGGGPEAQRATGA